MIYTYNDMASFLSRGILSIDALSTMFVFWMKDFLGPVAANNVFIILCLIISLLVTFFFFHVKTNKLTALLFGFLFTTSIYFVFRVISLTPGLYLIFIFPLTLYLLLKNTKPLIMGLWTLLFLALSNYYGFFSFLLVIFWYLFSLCFRRFNLKAFSKHILSFSLPIIIGVIIFFGSTLVNNLPIFGKYQKPTFQERQQGVTRFYRPLEDWYNLSFRPWYFFIPPKSSVFFGDLSKNIHQKIENTNYYLADDYMEEEMAGSYMGWHFLLGMGVVGVLLFLKRYKNKEFPMFKSVYENKEMIFRSFFIIFCILLISGPPSFTVRGIEIYTPSYLLYYIIPVFRTLVRWAVVIYLFVLIINSFLVQDLYNLMKTKFQKVLFILVFLSLNFVIFAIKIPVININQPPEEISFVKETFPERVPYAVYPKGDYYSIFWIISHEDLLINPVNFINYETGFDSNEFSKNLITEDGIQEFLKQNPKYLIYYPENISDDDLEKITKINSELTSKEDVRIFFEKHFGEGVVIGNSVVFNTLE